MAQQANNAKSLRSLQSLEREAEWGQSIRVKGKGARVRVPLESVSNAEPAIVITTPKLTSVNLLTQAPASTMSLGDKSEMAKAKRMEDAMTFWLNQRSFRMSPVRGFGETINANIETFPAEMRKALASGVVHTVRSNAATNRRRQLQSIFSEENLHTAGEQSCDRSAAASSISFSASEQ